jgi:hypothetical protein
MEFSKKEGACQSLPEQAAAIFAKMAGKDGR